jgi:hypothetical protein
VAGVWRQVIATDGARLWSLAVSGLILAVSARALGEEGRGEFATVFALARHRCRMACHGRRRVWSGRLIGQSIVALRGITHLARSSARQPPSFVYAGQLATQLLLALMALPQAATLIVYGRVVSAGPQAAWEQQRRIAAAVLTPGRLGQCGRVDRGADDHRRRGRRGLRGLG